MKKLLVAFFYLFIIYLIFQGLLLFFRGGHVIEYSFEIDNQKFLVKEEFVLDGKNSHYFIEIKVGEENFYVQTYQDFYRAEEIIRDIYFFETSKTKCLLPVFGIEGVMIDFICHQNDKVYNYRDLRGSDNDLDEKIKTLSPIYDVSVFLDESDNVWDEGFLSIYVDHVLENHFFYIDSYRGIDTINDRNLRKYHAVNIFRNDVYETSIKLLVDEILILADYNQQGNFDKFRKVNLVNNLVTNIDAPDLISFEAYFQGREGRILFVYDPVNKKQYQINVDNNNVIEIGNIDLGIKVLIDDEWQWKSVAEVEQNNYRFFPADNVFKPDGYYYGKKVMGEGGFIYYVNRNNQGRYNVYRASGQQPEYKKFLFSTAEPNRINFIYDFVYFKDGQHIRYYHDNLGIKTLVSNQEFSFNEKLDFGIYIHR